MAEATDKTLCALDSPAKQVLLALTKDCLNKFFKPKLYKSEEAMMVAQWNPQADG